MLESSANPKQSIGGPCTIMVRVAYEPNDKYTPEQISSLEQLDYQHITCHLVFAVKMDFIYNTHFVPNGLKIDAPLCQSHIQALLQEIVCDWH
ncbi:hypothetical protein HJC23_001049 [Cyclotella cryptica]|uniref:Uncharacterized protein n=1 Tax=Cyclotella cryptica TaxID=29204 RepID=A0ABD3QJF9_9STRA